MKQIQSLDDRLTKYPNLRHRFEELLEVVEGQDEELLKADDVEELVDQQLQGLGQELIQGWAQTHSARQQKAWTNRPGVTRKEKKTSGG